MDHSRLSFLKGHGTRNDFVLLPDTGDQLELDPELVRWLCDRRAGIGGDGVIRVVPDGDGRWFMDHWNSDGTTAEMCGNGARLFARYLVDSGLQSAGRFDILTRAGVRTAEVPPAGDVALTMGAVRLGRVSTARVGGRTVDGTAADVGNPHLACLVDTDPAEFDLTTVPEFDPAVFPDGVNVELVQVTGPGRLRMRVHERGVGETQSCGTGTVAAAAAYLRSEGRLSGTVTVEVPGGTVRVELADGDDDGFGSTMLAGPAEVVASGTVTVPFPA